MLWTPVQAQPGQTPGKQPPVKHSLGRIFHDWKLTCEVGKKRCYVFQNTTLTKTGQKIIGVVVGNLGPGGKHIMHFTAPLGIYIPAGVVLKINDGEQIKIDVHTCTAGGCEAMIDLDSKIINALKDAKTSHIAFLDAVTRRQINIAISMKGFNAAYGALKLKLISR